MFYNKNTNGFYHESIFGNSIPEGSVEITDDLHKQLLDGQSEGKQITSDDNGYPILIDKVDTRTYEEKRRDEYPPITDYLDAVVKGDQEQIQNYIDACLAVKTKYPKPE